MTTHNKIPLLIGLFHVLVNEIFNPFLITIYDKHFHLFFFTILASIWATMMLSSYSSLFLHPLLIISFFLFSFSFYQRFFLFFLKGFFLDLLYNLDNLDRSMILQKSHLHIAVINFVMISMQNKISLNSILFYNWYFMIQIIYW